MRVRARVRVRARMEVRVRARMEVRATVTVSAHLMHVHGAHTSVQPSEQQR